MREELFQSLQRATQRRVRGETWSDDQFRDARERDLSERTTATSSVVVATLICLTLAALLTSAKLVEIAERQELGAWRDRHVAAAEAIDRVANFLSLNRPYDLIQDIRGTGEDAGERVDTLEELEQALPSTTLPPAADGPARAEPAESTTSTTTTTTVPGPLRTVTAEAPLSVYVAGDSQAEYLSQVIRSENGGRPLTVEADPRISTSLARPDYFNWPAELVAVRDGLDPEAVVLFIGANDPQDMLVEGEVLVTGSPAWRAEWASRLALMFDLLEADHRHVFWVTQPPMRDATLDEGVAMLNEIAAPVVDDRSWVTAVDIWELFGGDGGYSQRVVHPATGEEIRARVDDGVHLTRSASTWLGELVFAAMEEVWAFG